MWVDCNPVDVEIDDVNTKSFLVFEMWIGMNEFYQCILSLLMDGAYYCYCAYVLRISRYSDFLSPMLTNTGVLLRGLKLSGESRS